MQKKVPRNQNVSDPFRPHLHDNANLKYDNLVEKNEVDDRSLWCKF